jgi:hypothetical protein
MKTNRNLSVQRTAWRVIRWMAVDAILGATCAGLYGFVFGGFGVLAQNESHRLISIAGIFALCGAVAGLLVGAYSAVSDAAGKSADASSPASDVVATDEKPVTAVRQFAATGNRRTQNSSVAV